MEEDLVTQRIRGTLKKLGIKQIYLADKIGIKPQALSRLFRLGITKSKYIAAIANALDVSEDYLITGNNKPVVVVDDEQLKLLIKDNFSNVDEKRIIIKDLLVKSSDEPYFFAYEIKASIDNIFAFGSVVVFSHQVNEHMEQGKIYLLLCNISQSFITGKYSSENHSLSNLHGQYLIQPNDKIVGYAVQITIYLDSSKR